METWCSLLAGLFFGYFAMNIYLKWKHKRTLKKELDNIKKNFS